MRRDPDDHHARQELLLNRKGDYARIEVAKRHSPFLNHRTKWIVRLLDQSRKTSRFGNKPPARRRGEYRRAQFGEVRHRSLRRKRDLRMPTSLEISDAKQVDPGQQQLLLDGEQSRQLHVSWVKLNLDDRVVQHLKFNKTEVLYCERRAVVIGIAVTQRRKKLSAILEHPLTRSSHQHSQPFHDSPRNSRSRKSDNFPSITDFTCHRLTAHESFSLVAVIAHEFRPTAYQVF